MSHILVVEDEGIIRHTVKRLLERNGYQVTDVETLTAALALNLENFDLIISDLRLPGGLGTELIGNAAPTPVLIMTSYASLNSAVDAMKLGAVDYIAKPFEHQQLLDTVEQNLLSKPNSDDQKERADGDQLDRSQTPKDDFNLGIIGESAPMQLLFKKIVKVSPTTATVLIQGESGTGKELVAKALHNNSPRVHEPLISVNCAAIPETLIESELFGHEKGAFTGAANQRQGLIEAAAGGTLFLDEIGELPLEAQARLLRVLQEGEIRRVGSVTSQKVDIRLIAATHRNLKQLAAAGKFREDLYYRLNVVELQVPPLRERDNDKLLIANVLLGRNAEATNQTLNFSDEAKHIIRSHTWPGNVRELENAIERAVIMADGHTIEVHDLGIELTNHANFDLREDVPSSVLESVQPNETSYPSTSTDLSLDDYLLHFLKENESTMTETELARKLGISRKSLWERRQKLGLPRKKDI